MQNSKIKAIIFDLGNVLIKVDFKRMLINHINNNTGTSAHEVMESAYNDVLFKQFCTGKIESNDFYQRLTRRYNLNMSFQMFIEKWCDIFELIDGMPEMISELSKSYKIGLLSDTDPIHWQYVLKKYPFLNSIKKPTLSYEVGYMKPHPEIYKIAVKNLNHSLDECLYIDDRPINVEGALRMGMHAVQFENSKQIKDYLKNAGFL